MNQAFSSAESSRMPEENSTWPEPKTARVRPPNSSWTVKSGGNTTDTELPAVFGLPKADTGNDIKL